MKGSASMTIAKIDNLTKVFTIKEKKNKVEKIAVNNVSFEIKKGEIIGFLGPNGAGKSTTIKILTGILHPTEGEAVVCDYVPWKQRIELTRNIGCLFGQKSQLNQFLPIIDSYRLLGAIYDIKKEELIKTINEYAEYFGIKDLIQRKANSLSLGQRMICEIVGAILHKPQIIFLDEPTIGLDIIMKQKVRDMVLKLNKEYGVTVVLTSHDIEDVKYLCERIIIINHGEIVLDENMATIKNELLTQRKITVNFDKKVTDEISQYIKNAEIIEKTDNAIKLKFDIKEVTVCKLIDSLSEYSSIEDIDIEHADIEQIIFKAYKTKKG
ncbi:MAG: ATP-binding cassette domain-containing protein [Clostridiales bacterium]|nr:ATP-binding cassette domain-containing protein [Clostridiales bacterium]